MRIKTSMPSFTPPAPYTLEPNPDSLLDKSDLVFINPVGTGYSAAIAPHINKDFWGVDQDAGSLRQFIKRYLTRYDRWNSPKFLFGESYGTARSCVLAYLLHEDGVDLNGVTLQSSILDYSKAGNPVGLLPTLCADAWYHKKITVTPPPTDLPSFMSAVVPFAQNDYAKAPGRVPERRPGHRADAQRVHRHLPDRAHQLGGPERGGHRQPGHAAFPDRRCCSAEGKVARRLRRARARRRHRHRRARSTRCPAATTRP